MATIATIAGATITLPGLLSGSWTALKFAYDLYGQVDLRKTQLKLFLDRCNDLLLRVAESLPSEGDVSDGTRESIEHFQATCESLRDVIEKLKRKGFLWCMVNKDKIDTQMFDVQSRIADAFALFNFSAHISIEEFHQRLLQARDQDQMQLITKLDSLSENDQQIIDALKYQDGVQKRVEELLVDVLKCVQNLEIDHSPQARFLRTASVVLQKASKNKDTPEISADYVITSLEVDFQDTDPIGQGAFGHVFKGEWNGSPVAIKQMYMDSARSLSEDDRKVMYREVRHWRKLHHPNILDLYGVCLEATLPFLVMQYCPSGNMCKYLVENPDTNRVDISYDVVAGMICLHNKDIVHADLKGANILIDKGTALVADFGLSAVMDDIRSRSAQSSIATSVRGTPQWMAPECHKGKPPVKASDIYSLGLTMWEAFSGEIPYKNVYPPGLAFAVAVENQRPERPARLTEEVVWIIIQECWAPDPADRPSIQEVQSRLSPYTTRGTGDRNVMAGSSSHSGPSVNGSYPPHPPAGFVFEFFQESSQPISMPATSPYQGLQNALRPYPAGRAGIAKKRKALIIGINYSQHRDHRFRLKYCTGDARIMANFLCTNLGFAPSDIRLMTDESVTSSWNRPTKDNILGAMKDLVRDAQPQDSFFVYFSGHGVQIKDLDGDEPDGLDECICAVDYLGNPYLNADTPGLIVDDIMHKIMVKSLPPQCHLTAIFDSCHWQSGTVLDLPHIYRSDGGVKKFRYPHILEGLRQKAIVISLSAIKDNQSAQETYLGGALGQAFIDSMGKFNNTLTYKDLIQNVREYMKKNKFPQKPQLSSSHEIDTNLQFIV